MYAGLAFIFVLLLIAFIYGLVGGLFALVWNFVMPVFWHGAPHISWLVGVGCMWLLGLVQGIFFHGGKSE